jgi:hypothetical protein
LKPINALSLDLSTPEISDVEISGGVKVGNTRYFKEGNTITLNVIFSVDIDNINSVVLPTMELYFSNNVSPVILRNGEAKGLRNIEYKYVVEDSKTRAIVACIILQTTDNENYLVDIIQSSWADLEIDNVLSYAIYQIKKRKKRFGLFVRTKKYLNYADKQENFMVNNGFECVQNQIVLTNSSARILKESNQSTKYTVLTDFLPIKALPTQCNKL